MTMETKTDKGNKRSARNIESMFDKIIWEMIAVIRAAEAINPLPFTRNGHPNMCRCQCVGFVAISTIEKMARNAPRKQTHRHKAQYRVSKMLLIGHCARQSKTKQQKHEKQKLRHKNRMPERGGRPEPRHKNAVHKIAG